MTIENFPQIHFITAVHYHMHALVYLLQLSNFFSVPFICTLNLVDMTIKVDNQHQQVK